MHTLTHMGHKQQQPTLIRSDISIVVDFVNKNMQMKQSKTWDMQFCWLRDKKIQIILTFLGQRIQPECGLLDETPPNCTP